MVESACALWSGLCTERWRANRSLAVVQACLADIAGPGANSQPDGVVDVHDLLKILSGYSKKFPSGHHPADIDKNNDVDVTDLLFILKNFDKVCEKQARGSGGFFGR